MNTAEVIWIYLFVYFSARLLFMDTRPLLKPGRIRLSFPFRSILFGFVFLMFVPNIWLAVALFILHGLAVSAEFLALKTKRIPQRWQYWAQLALSLLVLPVIIRLLTGAVPPADNMVHTAFLYFIRATTYLNTLLQQPWSGKLAAIATGFIFTLKEATIIIRFALQRIQAVPPDAAQPDRQDEKEYERGRFIGNLERSLIYFLILSNQIGAIAIIIALKSLARFKKMDDKDFAEYFLIGSFLSLILAALPAVIVKLL